MSTRSQRESAEKWFQRGLECEQTGARAGCDQGVRERPLRSIPVRREHGSTWARSSSMRGSSPGPSLTIKKALEADPEYALAHFNMANLYDERGDYRRALKHYHEAVRLSPTYADAHYNLALLYQGSGQVMEAVRHWKMYLKLDPASAWGAIARRELEKLRKSTVVQGPGRRRVLGRDAGLKEVSVISLGFVVGGASETDN